MALSVDIIPTELHIEKTEPNSRKSLISNRFSGISIGNPWDFYYM